MNPDAGILLTILRLYFLVTGILFFISTGVSMLRFHDVYARLHSASKCLTGGSLSVLLAYLLQVETGFTAIKVLLATVFLLLTNPIASHALARSAYRQGCFIEHLDEDEYRRDLREAGHNGR